MKTQNCIVFNLHASKRLKISTLNLFWELCFVLIKKQITILETSTNEIEKKYVNRFEIKKVFRIFKNPN